MHRWIVLLPCDESPRRFLSDNSIKIRIIIINAHPTKGMESSYSSSSSGSGRVGVGVGVGVGVNSVLSPGSFEAD